MYRRIIFGFDDSTESIKRLEYAEWVILGRRKHLTDEIILLFIKYGFYLNAY